MRLYDRIWVVSPGAYAEALVAEGRFFVAYGLDRELRISENVGHAEGYRAKVDSTLRQCDRLGA